MTFARKALATSSLSLLLLMNCAGGSGADKIGSGVGRPVASISTPALWQGPSVAKSGAETVTILDLESGEPRLLQFSNDPFSLTKKIDLPSGDYKSVVGAAAYTVAMQDRSLYVVNDSGIQRAKSRTAANFVSLVFEPRANVFILADDAKSLLLVALSDEGSIMDEWRAGPKIGDSYIEIAIAIDADRALIKTTDGAYHLAALTASINSKAWVLSALPLEIEAHFLADAFLEEGGIVMGYNATEVFSLQLPTGAIVDRLPLGDAIVQTVGRDFAPHVILSAAAGFADVVTVGASGKLRKSRIIASETLPISTTFDPRGDLLVAEIPPVCIENEPYYSYSKPKCILWNTGETGFARVYRVQLADNLLLDVTPLAVDARYVLTPDYVFLQRDSILGATERREYGEDGDRQVIDRYNLDLLPQISKRRK